MGAVVPRFGEWRTGWLRRPPVVTPLVMHIETRSAASQDAVQKGSGTFAPNAHQPVLCQGHRGEVRHFEVVKPIEWASNSIAGAPILGSWVATFQRGP